MIRQYDAQVISDNLLKQYPRGFDNLSLWNQGWRTNFSKATTYLARCEYDTKRVVLSTVFLASSSELEVKESVLHEIAHALVGPGHGHDQVWKNKAIELHISDKPCGNLTLDDARSIKPVEQKEKKRIGQLQKLCPNCGKVFKEVSHVQMSSGTWYKGECGHLVKMESLNTLSFNGWKNIKGDKTIFPYQAEGIQFIAQAHGRALVADEPGLGKTLQAIGFTYFYKDIAAPVLWVCKSKLKLQAVKEYLEWCGPEWMAQTIDTAKDFILPGLKVYVISMDLLRRIDNEKIKALNIKTVVADEIQHFKNPDSTRTAELRRLVNNADFFVPLSGTPWKNRGDEYFPVLNMLMPERFPSYAAFENNWVDYYLDERSGKYKKGGIRNIEKFKEYTKDIVIRRLRDEVQPDLPKINRQVRFVELDKMYGESYEKAEGKVAAALKDMILSGENAGMNMAAEIMKLKHITGLAKVETCVEDVVQFIDDTNGERKLAIGHHHIDVGDLLEMKLNEYLVANGYNKCLRIKGGDSKEVWNIQEAFKNNPKNIVCLISTLAGGEGLNLQFCTDAMQLERQWNHTNEEQFELRFSRPGSALTGSGQSIRIPYFIAADTVDEMLTDIVERKRASFLKAMNSHVCAKCHSRNTKLIDNTSVCGDCNHEEKFSYADSDIIRELSEAIIRKRYGSKK